MAQWSGAKTSHYTPSMSGVPINPSQTVNPLGGKAEVEIKMEGKGWITLYKFVKYVGQRKGYQFKRDFAKVSRDYLKRFQGLLWKGLLSEGAYLGVAWAPHSEEYNSKSNILMYREGGYFRALKNMQVIQKNYNTHLFIQPGDGASKSFAKGKTLNEYAKIHEHGSIMAAIPARPLWFPAYAKLEKTRSFATRLQGAIGKRLNTMGIEVRMKVKI